MDVEAGGPEGDLAWNKKIGALPIYKTAEKDPFYADPALVGGLLQAAEHILKRDRV